MSNTSKEKHSETPSTDSEDYYSADEDIPATVANDDQTKQEKLTVKLNKKQSPSSRKKSSVLTSGSPKHPSGNQTRDNDKAGGDERPVPPPRRKKMKSFKKQSSLEEPNRPFIDGGNGVRRANTLSWPRGDKPAVQNYEQQQQETESTDSTPVHKPSASSVATTSKESISARSQLPSISIEPNESLQLTEELFLENSEVESDDIILSKAVNSNTSEGVMVFLQSDEEEDESDQERAERRGIDQSEDEYEEEEEEVVAHGGGAKQGGVVPPSDSQILEATYIKNLDTGEAFPLSLADMRIPQGQMNPVDSLCDEREKAASRGGDSWDGNGEFEGGGGGVSGPGGGATANQKKPRKKRFKKFFVKGSKRKTDHRKDVGSLSDDEGGSPEHETHTVKYKAASHNKGKLDFERVRLKQEFSHTLGNEMMAVWVLEFSICGRLLATAGQDSIVRVWVLRTAYHFFHDLQVKYAKFGVHSSADSLSERSSVNSSMSSDPDDDSPSMKPFLEQPLCTYTGHSADVLDLSWSKNFFLLSSSMDKTVRLWHISRKECLCCFQHVDFVTSVAFHPRDDRYFLSGSLDGKLRLWNIPDKKVALWNELEGVGSHLITAANFCMNGKLAVAGTYDGRCIFYETEHLKYHTQIHVKSRHGKNRGRKISGIEPLPGEDKILVTSNDSRLRLYNLKDHSLTCKYKGCLNSQSQIRATFSREGEYIVSGSEDHYIYVWKTHHDFNKLSSVRRDRNDYYESFSAHSAPVTAVTFAPVPGITVDEGLRDIGEVIVAGDNKGNIKIYVTSEDL